MSAAPLIEAAQLALTLGRGGQSVRLEIPSLQIAEGEQCALTGPSGCGKTTFLHLAAGLLVADAGRLTVLGTDLRTLSHRGRDDFRGRHVGYVFQGFHLLDSLSALENVLVGMRFSRKLARSTWRPRAEELLDRMGIADRMHRHPGQLSVGERQRVAIARAVASKPEILLADEPTAALDEASATRVVDLLLETGAAEHCTVLVVTHDAAVAGRFARRIDARGFITSRAGEPVA